VFGGSAMVLRGLRPDTRDIDTETLDPVFSEMHKKYGKPELHTSSMGDPSFKVPNTPIEVYRSMDKGYGNVPGIVPRVATEKALLDFYLKMNREKDQPWIKVLKGKLGKKSAAYEPQMNIKDLLSRYPHLKGDPVHEWRSRTGVELIHREPDKAELRRIIRNWKLMNEEQKRLSETKSRELFGKGNLEHGEELLKAYQLSKRSLELDLKKGDTILTGRFRNVPVKVKKIGKDELGQPTVNGRKMLAFRIQKLMPGFKKESGEIGTNMLKDYLKWMTR